MVDPVSGSGGVGSVKGITSTNKPANNEKTNEQSSSSGTTDEVQISAEAQEALSVSQAESAAQDVRSELQKNLDLVLGIDPTFAEQVGTEI